MLTAKILKILVYLKRIYTMKSIIQYFLSKTGYNLRKKKEPFSDQKKLITSKFPVILDAGFHNGQTSRKYRQFFPSSKIWGFEPTSDLYLNSLKSFSKDDKLIIQQKAISDKVGFTEFCINNISSTNSLLPRNEKGKKYFSPEADLKEKIQVKTTTIDQIIKDQDLDKIDILKMDIQGGELMALKGAIQALENQKIDLIYLEMFFIEHYSNSPMYFDLAKMLSDYGYKIFSLYDLRYAADGQLRYCDGIFLSEKFRKETLNL